MVFKLSPCCVYFVTGHCGREEKNLCLLKAFECLPLSKLDSDPAGRKLDDKE